MSDAPGPHETVLGALDVPIDLPLATAASRSLAWLVDALALALIYTVLVSILLVTLSTTDILPLDAGGVLALITLAGFGLEWGWHIAFEQLWRGQTPGKRVLGLRVVERDGAPVGLWGSIVRNLLRPLDFFPGTYSVGLAATVLSRRHQRLGDWVAGTLVVREPEPRPTHGPTRFPEGISSADVALVEAWFAREPELEREAHARLADELLGWVARQWPTFAQPAAGERPAQTLRRVFGVPWTT